MKASLIRDVLRGLKWSYAATIVNVVLLIGMTAILARLIEPAAFGLVAMAHVLLRFGRYFAAGLEPAVVQKKNLSETDVRTSFTISVLVGVAVFVIFFLLSPLLAQLMPSPGFATVLRVLALTLLLSGLSTTALGLLRRKLDFRALGLIDIGAYVMGYCVVGLTMALNGYGVWSLVAANLMQGTTTLLFAYLCTRHSLRPSLARGSRKHVFGFGARASLAGFLDFLGSTVDTLLIGRLLGAAPVGIYTRAMALIDLPVQYLSTPILKVTFPTLTRVQDDPGKFREAYGTGLMLLALVSIPIGVGVMPAAPEVVLTLLGPDWTPAIPILRLLGLYIPLAMITSFTGSICMVTGRMTGRIVIQVLFILVLLVTIPVAVGQGLVTVAAVIVSANLIRFLALSWVVGRIAGFGVSFYGRALMPGLLAAALSLAAIASIRTLLIGTAPALLLLAEIVAGAVVLGILLYFPPQPLRAGVSAILARTTDDDIPGLLRAWLARRYSA